MTRYPPNWKSIRARILDRAQHRCEWCGLVNYTIGYRAPDGSFWTEEQLAQSDGDNPLYQSTHNTPHNPKPIRIVLTIAHIHNPDPMDCRDENLAALCQRCHNRYDAPMRAKHAAVTRKQQAQKGQLHLL